MDMNIEEKLTKLEREFDNMVIGKNITVFDCFTSLRNNDYFNGKIKIIDRKKNLYVEQCSHYKNIVKKVKFYKGYGYSQIDAIIYI